MSDGCHRRLHAQRSHGRRLSRRPGRGKSDQAQKGQYNCNAFHGWVPFHNDEHNSATGGYPPPDVSTKPVAAWLIKVTTDCAVGAIRGVTWDIYTGSKAGDKASFRPVFRLATPRPSAAGNFDAFRRRPTAVGVPISVHVSHMALECEPARQTATCPENSLNANHHGTALPDPAWHTAFRRRLRAWYACHARDLPWRRSRDPYAIWVSEIMLQQTQVATVEPYFLRFLDAFPTIADLAAADRTQVMRLWEGLGYYRRATQMHRAAEKLVAEHGARFPRDPQAVLRLPGIGRYTAGAILSIAFDLRQPILEANTLRLFRPPVGLRRVIRRRRPGSGCSGRWLRPCSPVATRADSTRP